MSKTDEQRTCLLQTDQRTSPAIRDKLGEQLRAMYGRPEEEPLPDNLAHPMRQLGQTQSA
jgi:hypothetical protein